jgi:alkanesulfonate monooxygenase SsuD/methylene tetrahydromethanopterin reductase-like flavin-dependent oxidoreductase (luciferase family)
LTDYGHELLFGSFITPAAADADLVVTLARLSERVGLDLVTFQDHPYQPAFLDTWTLMSYVAASTERISLSANVLHLPLRQPAIIARSAASLDLLSGGRLELGLGAGAFWEAIEAMGGRKLKPGQAVDALEEAIQVIREIWASGRPGGVRVDGDYYRVVGAKRGPAPAHDIGIWIGAYKPRMLRLVGKAADGWLPSLGYLPGGPSDLAELNAIIDESATENGRDPLAVRRLMNITGTFGATSRGFLDGPPHQWAEEIAGLAFDYGVSAFILGSDDPTMLQQFAAEVAPEVRALVSAGRENPGLTRAEPAADIPTPFAETETRTDFDAIATRDDGVRLSDRRVWDEESRPTAPPPPVGHVYREGTQQLGRHLVDVHDHLRAELRQLRDLIEQVKAGTLTAGHARSAINEMTMRQNDWTLGAYCASYCRVVTGHHSLEDAEVFPHLRRADSGLAPVIDRLEEEHVIIHDILEEVDRALVGFIRNPEDFTELDDTMDVLSDALLSHLSYEERQIIEPLARLGFYAGQV